MTHQPWEFWIDVGGTFTDCLARRPDGTIVRHKLLSSGTTKSAAAKGSTEQCVVDPARRRDPAGFWDGFTLIVLDKEGQPIDAVHVRRFDSSEGTLELDRPLSTVPHAGQPYELHSGEEAPIVAIRYLLGLRLADEIPPVVVRLGTTRGTNALVTRSGARTALVTTRGFGDVLLIGYQNRPRIFELAIRKPEPLTTAVVEIDERVLPDGKVLVAPDPEAIRSELLSLKEQGIESLAICLLHAYANAAHEQLVETIAHDVGFDEISRSSHVAPLVKIVSRGDTVVVDAYLNPVLRDYVATLRSALGDSQMRVLTSAGGLVRADRFVGKDSILSGPAGGVVGFSRAALAAGFERAIGFDMGGTSTDVSRFDGRYELEYETEKAGVRVVAPMMAIETVAAGGGSICRFDGVKLAVGPDSAGADPGPACYGRGGPLAVTDVNFFLGKIPTERFPFPLDRAAVETRLTAMCEEIDAATSRRYSPVELADGFLSIANANMASAIRSISIAKGVDPSRYVMVSFGGAAPQHACAVARQLGITQVLNHPDGGILSARGIGLADVVRHRASGVYRPHTGEEVAALEAVFDSLADEARREVLDEGIPADKIDVVRLLDLRYEGLDAYLTIPCPSDGDYAAAYVTEHEKLYGYAHADRNLEIVAVRVEVTGRSGHTLPESHRAAERTPVARRSTTTYFDAAPHETPIFDREDLEPGSVVTGPAILCEAISTTVVDPGWRAEVLSGGELLLTDTDRPERLQISTEADPVMLEIFNNHFAGIAEQMGITLRHTASSVNVKERLDFSCAVFTGDGRLVANAPHMPVHLGAMGETVRRVIEDNPDMAAGDVFLTNDPYRGGSHLPDLTVVTPVYDTNGDAESGRLLFFTASRAHHAEIGGISPGSMPPESKNLAEEGVVIRNFKLVAGGHSREAELRELLLSGEYPTRGVEHNLADVAAQVAANRQGERDLGRLVAEHSLRVVEAYMRHIQTAAEQKTRRALARLPDGSHTFTDHLDDGSAITATITVAGDSVETRHATVDFTGTAPVLSGNLNANRAIVTAAVMYCLRLLLDEDIPLNHGVLSPIRLVLPQSLLNPPERPTPEACAAMAGGNVETSQRVVDVLLGALGLAAASQGTMNNLVFGDATFGYYETICGGAGATPTADGAGAVHTHMTNTRLTDPEVLEQRYPVRLHEFSIRRGSGGRGARRGGDGVVRRIEFLHPLDVSILSQRRGPYPPYGLAGGGPGEFGRNLLKRTGGSTETLPCQVQFKVRPGDVLTIETPGGGGYGSPDSP